MEGGQYPSALQSLSGSVRVCVREGWVLPMHLLIVMVFQQDLPTSPNLLELRFESYKWTATTQK